MCTLGKMDHLSSQHYAQFFDGVIEYSSIWHQNASCSKWVNGYLNGFVLSLTLILFFILRPQPLSRGKVHPPFSNSTANRPHCQEALCGAYRKFSLLQFQPFSPSHSINPSPFNISRRMDCFSFWKLPFSRPGMYRRKCWHRMKWEVLWD